VDLLPMGYAERAWRLQDAEAIAEMINAYSKQVSGRETVALDSVRAQLEMPGLDLSTDTRLVLSPEGELAAAGFAIDLSDPHVKVQASGYVRHENQRRGIGTWLADWIEGRAREAIERAPEGARVSLLQTTDDRDESAKRLLESRGYEIVRHFWRMAVDLDDAGSNPVWPDGITVTTLGAGVDLRQAYRAGREAFEDHWGHVETPEDEGFERFTHRLRTDPDIDMSLRFVAMDGDEMVGVCYATPREGTDETTGYVEVLGVRPTWRKRGIALALLHHSFGELRKRGLHACALHVDSESLTGATRLYESAGMSISELNHAYELELSPGVELSRTGVEA